MENLKAFVAENLEALKPYLITAGASFALGLIFGLWI
jgi:hypothetical protein